MERLLAAILAGDRPEVARRLAAHPNLCREPIPTPRFYEEITHWIYAGDRALHVAAAAHQEAVAGALLEAGAEVNLASPHRNAGPLHYAADGYIGNPRWDPQRQVRTIGRLLEAGAEVNARDKNGATPLHRAVRTRCAGAVACLLEAGSDATARNKPGSTAFHLAVQNTGRGGTGEPAAKDAQRRIIGLFLAAGVSAGLKNSRGKTVAESATSDWVRALLAAR